MGGALNPMTSVLIRHKREDSNRGGEGDVKKEPEEEVRCHGVMEAMECGSQQKLKEARRIFQASSPAGRTAY